MKKKFNPQLLKEELKKFKLLSEYDFYQEKKEIPEYKDLLLGTELEEDEESVEKPNDLQPEDDIDSAAGNIADDLGVDDELPQGGEESNEEPQPPSDMEVDEPIEEPSGDEVEVDVTSLVKGSEEAKESADAANKNTEMLLNKLTDLETRISNMVKITDKIEGLEKEIIKRNPTPVEKLEMRSLNSAPFNQKLTDYWADKEGAYDVMGGEKKPKEYVLTKDDVDSTYSDVGISKTFSTQENLYEEEDISGYEEENI